MNQGIRELWNLSDPTQATAAASDSAKQFRQAFSEAIASINRNLQQAAPYAQAKQQSAYDAQRQTLYAAYQKVLQQMGDASGGAATQGAERVLAAASALRDKVQMHFQQTEAARGAWSSRQGELERAIDHVAEMEENGHEKSSALRKVIEAIQSRVNERSFGESVEALEQFLPKFGTIFDDFRASQNNVPTNEGDEMFFGLTDDPTEWNQAAHQADGPLPNDGTRHNDWGGVEYEAEGPFYGLVDDRESWGGLEYEARPGAPSPVQYMGLTPDEAKRAWEAASRGASDAWSWIEEQGQSVADAGRDAAEWVDETADDAATMLKGGESRPLTEEEIAYAKEIFGDHVDYSKIRVTKGSVGSVGDTSRTIGDSIHMSDDEFDGDSMKLSKRGLETLIHEMTHVHQYQKDGWEYAPHALWEQLKSWVVEGDRGGAYDWEKAEQEGQDPVDWNPEQQGAVVEEYNELLRKKQAAEKNGGALDADEMEKLERMKRHVDTILSAPPEKDLIDKAGEALSDAWDWTSETAGDAWDWTADAAEDAWDWASETADEAWDWTEETADEIRDWASQTAEDAWDWTEKTAEDAWDWGSEAAEDAWDWGSQTAEDAWDWGSQTAEDAWDWGSQTAEDVWQTAKDTASDTRDAIEGVASDAWEGVTDTATDVWDSMTDAWDSTSEGMSQAWDATKEAADATVDGLEKTWNAASDFADNVWSGAQDAAEEVWQGAQDAADYASDAADKAWDSATEVADTAWQGVEDAAEYASDAAGEAWDSAGDAVDDAVSDVEDFAGSVWNSITS